MIWSLGEGFDDSAETRELKEYFILKNKKPVYGHVGAFTYLFSHCPANHVSA
jgi:hypothetical protein